MKATKLALLCMLVVAMNAIAQSHAAPASLCSVIHDPAKFDGKFVQVSGTIVLGEFLVLRDSNCHDDATLEYPTVGLRPPASFRVLRDKNYFALQRALAFDHPHVRTDQAPSSDSFINAEPFRTSSARATIVGRVDAKRTGGFDGGGADTPLRIVIRRIVHVEPLSTTDKSP